MVENYYCRVEVMKKSLFLLFRVLFVYLLHN